MHECKNSYSCVFLDIKCAEIPYTFEVDETKDFVKQLKFVSETMVTTF